MTRDCRSGRMVLRTAAAAALVLLPTGALSAPVQTPPDSMGAIRGRVTSEAGGGPVHGARVRVELPDGARALRTDSAGGFRMEGVPAGPRPIEVRAQGFERKRVTARVPAGGTLRLELRLTPAPRQAPRSKTVGRVVASDGSPLAGVAVRADDTYLSTVTGSDGQFRMELPEDAGRLVFSRIGYRTRTVDLPPSVRTGSDTLGVTLVPRPVELKGITVEGRRLGGVESQALGHTVTTETVRQAPAVGEPDLFRSLVYLPNVSQPNDVKGRIHLAGGSSDETGYRLDGHPLQQPFHLLGLMGAFNVAALERADVRIHRYPISDGGRLSGLVDMSTRRASDEPHSESVVSILSSSFTMTRPEMPGDVDLLASGRVTYLDRIVPSLTQTDDYPQVGYYDGLLRLGRTWQPGWRAELLGFRSRNYFRFSDITREEQEPLNWGESLLGARLERQTGDWGITLRGSFNRAFTGLDERPVDEDRIDARRDWWSAEAEVERRAEDWRATAGLSVNHRRHEQSWDARSLAEDVFSLHVPGTHSGRSELTVLTGFAEASLDVTDAFSATGGTRLARTGEGLFAAPRMLLGYEASDELTVETSLGRRLQFDAEIEEPDAWSTMPPRFLLESPRTADIFASSVRWSPENLPLIGTGGRVRLTGFWKQYPDRPILVGRRSLPPTGRERPEYSDFPRFQRVPGRSVGFSLEARARIGENGLFQGSYTYQRVREEVNGTWSPASWDLPHNLSLFTSVPIFGDLTGNVAFRTHSGPPVTPIEARLFVPTRGFDDVIFENRVLAGERNSLRLDGYARLDLGLRHRFDGFGADWVLFGQVLNLFWARNSVGVDWEERVKYDVFGKDGIEDGLPVVPSFGLEVKW